MMKPNFAEPRPGPAVALSAPDPVAPELLNELRRTARACRSAARTNLFEACAMLSLNRDTARAAYLETLVRCLPQAINRSPVFYRPDVLERSFDEAWLMRLHDSLARADEDSFEFLLRSRVSRSARRNMVFLLSRISERALQS